MNNNTIKLAKKDAVKYVSLKKKIDAYYRELANLQDSLVGTASPCAPGDVVEFDDGERGFVVGFTTRETTDGCVLVCRYYPIRGKKIQHILRVARTATALKGLKIIEKKSDETLRLLQTRY
jgi:hypothetical protein